MLPSQMPNASQGRRNLVGRVTVNAAFLQEIKEVNADLWECVATLKRFCAAPISMRAAAQEFLLHLETLRDLLALQFSLEEAFGYFDSPVNFHPEFCDRAESLRQEHEQLYTDAARLHDEGEELLRHDLLAELTTIVPVAFDQFFLKLERHERLECELIFECACTDFGVGD
jgi:hypothetical protein